MKNYSCTKCNTLFSDLGLTGKSSANHIRWCGNTAERGTNKFQLTCSCIICKVVCSTQNIQSHFKSKHVPKISTNNCIQCNKAINNPKFCGTSCAAIYNNARKDYTTFKCGPPKTVTKENKALKRKKNVRTYIKPIKVIREKTPPFTRIQPCTICGKFHKGSGKSCSPECKSKLLSQSIKQAIYNGHDPKKNRGRGKRSWMESSFAKWLDGYQVNGYIIEHPFKRLDMVKTYFADFYFPDKKLIIELDGTQHKKTVAYDADRDAYISSTYGITIVRISYKEYQKQSRTNEIKILLNIR